MPFTDMPRSELVKYAPDLPWPEDLEDFWSATLAENRALVETPVIERIDTGLTVVDSFDVTFSGFGGHPIRAWLHLPAKVDGPLPAVVVYAGYGGGRGLPLDVSVYTLAGYGCLHMDTRGQGSAWTVGDTADPVGAAPTHPGFMTKGILDPHAYYYRRVYTDAVLAVEALRRLPMVRPDRVAVAGGSQGGGISLAVAALLPDVWAAIVDFPFLCDFPRATEIADCDPYLEIVRYLKIHRDHVAAAFATLAYFDAAALARLAKAPALFSCGLMDRITPPSTVYAAFNRYGGDKEMIEYPFNDHEGGGGFQHLRQLPWLASLM
jgi:cephalosporin-C deacetylase